MDIENIIDKLKKTTISKVLNEDWSNLTLILEKEPNQIFHFTEIIEQQIKKIISINEDIFEPIPNNPSYYRFKPGIEFVLKLIRARSELYAFCSFIQWALISASFKIQFILLYYYFSFS